MRILIVKLSSMGDIIHALPAVHDLKLGLKAEVDWVTQPEFAELVRCFEDVADVIPFPRRTIVRGFPEFIRRLRMREYDLAVDLQGLMKSAVTCRLARARRILGPSFRREGAGMLYHAVAGRRNKDRHAVEENLDAVRFLGFDVHAPVFPIRVPPLSIPAGRPRVALFPVSRRANKNWPEERFIEVARELRRGDGAHVFCMGGKSDHSVCAEIARILNVHDDAPAVTNLAGRTSMVEMAGWLAGMDLVIANDSGPVHLAAALSVPVLAIFGPTDPRRTGPYGAGHRTLVSTIPCRPCFRRDCRYETARCLEKVTAAEVLTAAREMLHLRKTVNG